MLDKIIKVPSQQNGFLVIQIEQRLDFNSDFQFWRYNDWNSK